MSTQTYQYIPLTTREVALHEAAHVFGHLKLSAVPDRCIKEIRVYPHKLMGHVIQLPDWSLAPDTLRGSVPFGIGPAFEILRGRARFNLASSDFYFMQRGLRCHLRDLGIPFDETDEPALKLANKMIERLVPILDRHMPTIERIAERIMQDRNKQGIVTKSKCARLHELLN